MKMMESSKCMHLNRDGQKSVPSPLAVSATTKSEINDRRNGCQLGSTLFGCGPSTAHNLDKPCHREGSAES